MTVSAVMCDTFVCDVVVCELLWPERFSKWIAFGQKLYQCRVVQKVMDMEHFCDASLTEMQWTGCFRSAAIFTSLLDFGDFTADDHLQVDVAVCSCRWKKQKESTL